MAGEDFISGFLGGQQAQLQRQDIAMNRLLLEEKPVKIEQEKLALKIAETDYSRREHMAQLIAQHSSSIPQGKDPMENAVNRLLEMSSDAAQSALPEESVDLASKATTLMDQRTKAVAEKARSDIEQGKYANQLLATATDQQSWDAMNSLVRLQTGKPSALEGQKYSPELVAQLKEATTKHLDAATEALRKAEAERARVQTQVEEMRIPLVKAQTDAERALADSRRKAGDGGPSDKDVKKITDQIQAEFGKAVTAPQARVLAGPIAEDMLGLVKTNHMTIEQAATAAYQNAKKRGDLKELSKPSAQSNTALTLIDDLRQTLNSVESQGIPLTGIGGMYERGKETVGNLTGLSDQTVAHDVQTKITALQLMMPKLLLSSGQFTKSKMAEIAKVVRGMSPGDTAANTLSSLDTVESLLTGKEPPSATPKVLQFDAEGNPVNP